MFCYMYSLLSSLFFFFNDTATTEIYTLSLHDALPIFRRLRHVPHRVGARSAPPLPHEAEFPRSEEHTSELQSRRDLVCRLLLEKKKKLKLRHKPYRWIVAVYACRHTSSHAVIVYASLS